MEADEVRRVELLLPRRDPLVAWDQDAARGRDRGPARGGERQGQSRAGRQHGSAARSALQGMDGQDEPEEREGERQEQVVEVRAPEAREDEDGAGNREADPRASGAAISGVGTPREEPRPE